ncbi:zinc-binding dehydrogenase [Nocardiopsis eucommiae]|uniref:Zinc-binding dehydrogenase n=1 Tax=Nocardiopsis eucommiae TaxID=2831970 RepID=A0A975L883_9ACTN|nr:zinc-binding dehydrogenase [Nocardiopsis eucommiae]
MLATASPGKWDLLRSSGLTDDEIAHSREPGFEERFRAAAGGVDVVLNSLTGDAITASLRLLSEGGRFVELGHNELLGRDDVPEDVTYLHFNVMEVGPERIQRAFAALLPLLVDGTLTRGPLTRYPIEEAPEAFQVMQRGHNVGKAVLELSTRFRPGGTVLVTGAMGRLGALVARHLVLRHGVENLLLVSRRGRRPRAPTNSSPSSPVSGRTCVSRPVTSPTSSNCGCFSTTLRSPPSCTRRPCSTTPPSLV